MAKGCGRTLTSSLAFVALESRAGVGLMDRVYFTQGMDEVC